MDNHEELVDHYAVLGLGCGSEIAILPPSLTEQEITKAYRSKARQLHPDKRPNDCNAHANFLKLQDSYQLLKNHNSRKLFDDDLLRRIKLQRAKNEKKKKIRRRDSKMMSDLEERERGNSIARARRQGDFKSSEHERISRQYTYEISRIIAMHRSKKNPPPPPLKQDTTTLHAHDPNPKIRFPHDFENLVLRKVKARRDEGP